MPRSNATGNAAETNSFGFVEHDIDEAELLAGLESEVEEVGGYPHAQILTLPNQSLVDIRKLEKPWGIFVTLEEAEKAKFTPSKDWVPANLEIEDEDKPEEPLVIEGFKATTLRFVVLAQSQLEIEHKVNGRWRFVDTAYKPNYGGATEVGQRCFDVEKDDEGNAIFRACSRYLIFFLDENQRPIHEVPLLLRGRGALGKVLSGELKDDYIAMGKAYAKSQKRNKVLTLAPAFKARCFHLFRLELIKPASDRAPYAVVAEKLKPMDLLKSDGTMTKGKQFTINRETKSGAKWPVIVHEIDFRQVLVANPEDKAFFAQNFAESAGFAEPNQGRATAEPASTEAAQLKEYIGMFDPDPDFEDSGDTRITFNDQGGDQFPAIIPVTLSLIPDETNYEGTFKLIGKMKDNVLYVDAIKLVPPVIAAEPIPAFA